MADEQILDLATAEVQAVETGTKQFGNFYGGVQRFIRRVLIPIVIAVWAAFLVWTTWQPAVEFVKTLFVASDGGGGRATDMATAAGAKPPAPQELRFEVRWKAHPDDILPEEVRVREWCFPVRVRYYPEKSFALEKMSASGGAHMIFQGGRWDSSSRSFQGTWSQTKPVLNGKWYLSIDERERSRRFHGSYIFSDRPTMRIPMTVTAVEEPCRLQYQPPPGGT